MASSSAHAAVHRVMLCSLLLAAAAPLLAASPDGAPDRSAERTVDPRAEEVIERLTRTLSGARTMQAGITQTMRMESEGQRMEEDVALDFAFERPNRLALTPREPDAVGAEHIISDGRRLFLYYPDFNRYVDREAPADLLAFFTDEAGAATGHGPLDLLAPVLAPEGLDGRIGTVRSATYNGVEEIDGRQTDSISIVVAPSIPDEFADDFMGEFGAMDMHFPLDLWIDRPDAERTGGVRGLPRRVRIDLSEMVARMAEHMGDEMPFDAAGMQYEIIVNFRDFTIDQEISEARFAFDPPEDAEKVDSIFDLFDMGAEAAELLGRPAPDFELDLADGGTMSLSAHEGRDIVILDFWATWCAPCIAAMPDLMAVAEEYRDQGVVLYAINQEEPADRVNRFLGEREWDLAVPLDRDGAVSRQYQVYSLPQTIIIGRDGSVQAVHLGFVPELKQQMRGELDTLLAGRRLAEPPAEEPEAEEADD